MSAFLRRHRKKLVALGSALGLPLGAHLSVPAIARFDPPPVEVPRDPVVEAGAVRRFAGSYARDRAGVREVYLEGPPERLGAAHAALLGDRMIADEGAMYALFQRFVPVAAARALIMDVSRVRYRNVWRGIPEPRRRELAAEAARLEPIDAFAGLMPTYQRLVFLHSAYDIALSFEHSPLVGCTSFGLGPETTKDGHVLFARAFDFEAGDVFDTDKAVLMYRPEGAIPFASVAWPGLTGVVSGMNAEGVAAVVHGGRAREPRTEGMPVVFGLREVLERAHDAEEAVRVLAEQPVLVSHIVFVGDAKGAFVVVERAPGEAVHARWQHPDRQRVGVTNHFEGPLASDPRNERVRAGTTSVDRRARIDELLAAVPDRSADVRTAVEMLRDHRCAKGAPCALGDRRSIDALIATHGLVADLTDRVLWVSKGPHLSGRFVRFDLRALFAPGHDPAADPPPETLEEDRILSDGRYDEAIRSQARPTKP
jgi:isopenicillin-N N-acyltransferase-like protein